MTQQHPITPPPELVQQWMEEFTDPENAHWKEYEVGIAIRAARWGADQELEACCEWLEQQTLCGHQDLLPSFRAARRPKPPSLKEQALALLDKNKTRFAVAEEDVIRLALESLPD